MARKPSKAAAIVVPDPEEGGSILRPRDALVRDAADLMLEGRWQAGHSVYALAKKHQVSKAIAEAASREGARYLRVVVNPEATRLQLLAQLRGIAEENEGDRVPAIMAIAKMSGAAEPPKDDGPSSPEERVERLCCALADPDHELLEALHRSRQAVWDLLFAPGHEDVSRGCATVVEHS